MSRRLYFIRHGETADNVNNVYSGQADTPLNEHGRSEAREAVSEVRELNIDLIVSSDLSRAYETAEILAEGIGYPKERIRKNSDLREVKVGTLTGTPDKGREYLSAMRAQDPTIETREAVFARLRRFLKTVEMEDGNILIVAHQGSGVLLTSLLTGIEPLQVPGLANCEVYELPVLNGARSSA